jgi:hypothetical protein
VNVVVNSAAELAPGARIEVTQPKTGTPPWSNLYQVAARSAEDDAWIMTNGSRIPDTAPSRHRLGVDAHTGPPVTTAPPPGRPTMRPWLVPLSGDIAISPSRPAGAGSTR